MNYIMMIRKMPKFMKCNIWMISSEFNWIINGLSGITQLNEFAWVGLYAIVH